MKRELRSEKMKRFFREAVLGVRDMGHGHTRDTVGHCGTILAKLQNEADTIHLALRSQVIKWMRSNKGFFLQEEFLPEEYIGPEDDRDNFFNDEVSFN